MTRSPIGVLYEKADLFVRSGFRDEDGVWYDGPHLAGFDAALADVERLVEAARGVMSQMDYETPHHVRLRGALVVVR